MIRATAMDNCASCRFLNQVKDDQTVGVVHSYCWRNPPQSVILPTPQGGFFPGFQYPVIGSPEHQSCGEHKPRPVSVG